MNLEKILKQFPVTQVLRIKDHLNGLGMTSMIAISRVRHLAAAVTDPRRYDARVAPDQALHTPEAPAGQDRPFFS